uniref:C-type lectin domain-containing protein n=1 Tax=Lygus hesperus TaxID=30085 RepID=A0A0K8SSM4_LYGHE
MTSTECVIALPILLVAFAVFTMSNGGNAGDVVSTHGIGYIAGDEYQLFDGSSPEPLTKWFEVYNISMTWFEALLFCKSRHGNLATIRSPEENDLLSKMAVQSLGPRSQYWVWIGGKRLESMDEFIWMTDGHPFTYTNWFPGYPANGSRYPCVVNYYNGTMWSWFTYDCGYKFNACSCEYQVNA